MGAGLPVLGLWIQEDEALLACLLLFSWLRYGMESGSA